MLQILWIYKFCEFTRYLVFWLYFGCTDFPHFFTPDFPDELQKSKFLIVQDNFSKFIDVVQINYVFKRVNGKSQIIVCAGSKNQNSIQR